MEDNSHLSEVSWPEELVTADLNLGLEDIIEPVVGLGEEPPGFIKANQAITSEEIPNEEAKQHQEQFNTVPETINTGIYLCAQCDDKFTNEDLFVAHLNTHNQFEPKSMIDLLKKLDNPALSNIAKSVNTNEIEENEEPKVIVEQVGVYPYSCGECVLTFANKTLLEAHNMTVHPEDSGDDLMSDKLEDWVDSKLFPCIYCDQIFHRKASLSWHTKKHQKCRDTELNKVKNTQSDETTQPKKRPRTKAERKYMIDDDTNEKRSSEEITEDSLEVESNNNNDALKKKPHHSNRHEKVVEDDSLERDTPTENQNFRKGKDKGGGREIEESDTTKSHLEERKRNSKLRVKEKDRTDRCDGRIEGITGTNKPSCRKKRLKHPLVVYNVESDNGSPLKKKFKLQAQDKTYHEMRKKEFSKKSESKNKDNIYEEKPHCSKNYKNLDVFKKNANENILILGRKPYSPNQNDKDETLNNNMNTNKESSNSVTSEEENSPKKNLIKKAEENTYICDICDESFYEKVSYTLHIKTHDGEPNQLRNTHHEIKNKSDEDNNANCNTYNQDENKIASRDLNTDKIYKCEYCNKDFHLNITYRRHIKTHTADQYPCSIQEHEQTYRNSTLETETICRLPDDKSTMEAEEVPIESDDTKELEQATHKSKAALKLTEHATEIKTPTEKEFETKNSYTEDEDEEMNNQPLVEVYLPSVEPSELRDDITSIGVVHSQSNNSIAIFDPIETEQSQPVVYVETKSTNVALSQVVKVTSMEALSSSNIGGIVKCEICDLTFEKYSFLSEHYLKEHGENNPYVCDNCGEKFAKEINLTNHILTHTADFLESNVENKKYSCEHCNEGFQSNSDLIQHMVVHYKSENTEHICKYCDKQFHSKRNLKSHIRRHTTKKYKCSICRQSFNKKISYGRHVNIHLDAFKCDYCDDEFQNPRDLATHLEEHDENNLLYSSEFSATKKEVAAHKRSKNESKKIVKPKPYPCTFCKQSFTFITTLNKHISRMHKPQTCELCNKVLRSSLSLKSHMLITHTLANKTPHRCTICNKEFKLISYLNKHLQSHPPEKLLPCTFCGQKFNEIKDLKQHIINTHTGCKQYSCDHCGKKFVRRNGLTWHQKRQTCLKPLICNDCGNTFKDRKGITKHINNNHKKRNPSDEKQKPKGIYVKHLTETSFVSQVGGKEFSANTKSITNLKDNKLNIALTPENKSEFPIKTIEVKPSQAESYNFKPSTLPNEPTVTGNSQDEDIIMEIANSPVALMSFMENPHSEFIPVRIPIEEAHSPPVLAVHNPMMESAQLTVQKSPNQIN